MSDSKARAAFRKLSEVDGLFEDAKDALSSGDFERAESLYEQASDAVEMSSAMFDAMRSPIQ